MAKPQRLKLGLSEDGSEPVSRVASTTNINDKQYESQDGFSCPRCKLSRVVIGYPDIKCGACGWSEPLIDFPISWDWHRHYCREYGVPDPGPLERPEHTLEEVNERLKLLEEHFDSLADEDLRRLGFRNIKEELVQLKLGLRYTQRLIPRKPTKRKVPKKVVTTEV